MHIQTHTEDETRYDHLDPIEAIAISWSCREGDPHAVHWQRSGDYEPGLSSESYERPSVFH